jgi:Carboxypeptidase regulatory-like domain
MLTRRERHIARCLGVPLAISILFAGTTAFIALPLSAVAQQAPARVVQGKVELGNGSMAKGAIVYLKNAKTLEVRTYISTDDGSFRFGQLNSDASYTVWAEYQGRKSKEKGVSSFDNKKVFDLTLKIEG